MESKKPGFLQNYASILRLLCGIVIGSLFGLFFKQYVSLLKPVGDIFLNLLFTAVVPLVFFAISSVIAHLGASRETGRLIGVMIIVFIATVLIAALLTLFTLFFFPIRLDASAVTFSALEQPASIGDQFVQLLTVSDFSLLLSRKSMLALIIFSILIGAAARLAATAGESFRAFLSSGNAVMKNLLQLIMKLAPFGLGAYFAYQVATIGPQLFGTYAHTLAVAHGVSIFYYIVVFTIYAMLAGGVTAVKKYWKNNITPSLTALATCSSIATMPANLQAAEKMGIPARVADFVVPLGATLHKEGSSIAAVLKVAVALVLSNKSILSWDTAIMALLIAVLVSIIEGGIPNGGYVGELLIISAYHMPVEALPVMLILGTLLDPIATLLNATGDTVSGLLIARILRTREQQGNIKPAG
ncbi:MAG: dicarboxylate/amino acid:cation symporter [Chitinophagaceae bacterium]